MPGQRLRDLLRALDDPAHLEHPADYTHAAARARFNALAAALDEAFQCRCEVDREVQDASFHGRIDVPGEATRTGAALILVISNFGPMVVCALENPGMHDDEETDALVDSHDAGKVRVALAEQGYLLVPEEPLWQPYDGPGRLRGGDQSPHLPSWYERFFDYL